jgi:hypothetical protein
VIGTVHTSGLNKLSHHQRHDDCGITHLQHYFANFPSPPNCARAWEHGSQLDLFSNNGHTSSIQPLIVCSNALKPLGYTGASAKHTPCAYSILLQISPFLAHLDYFQSQWLDRHNTILKSQHASCTFISIQSLTRSYHPKSKPKA